MDPLHATLHKASRSVVLDPHVKDGFRRTLVSMTEPTGIPQEASFRVPRALVWSMVAIIAATTGATVTFASSKAIPGDALYSVKIKALEPTERALAFTADAQAQVAVAHLERRFREAAELSANGRLEAHDEELALLAEPDVKTVDRDDQPEARARFEALAATYGSALIRGNARFAATVRLGDFVSDGLAKAAAEQQLAIAKEKRDNTKSRTSLAVSNRIAMSNRLSKAAGDELAKGSFQSALELSGAAAKVATEAQLFASFATSTPEEASSTTSTVIVSTTTVTATTSVQASSTTVQGNPGKPSILRRIFR